MRISRHVGFVSVVAGVAIAAPLFAPHDPAEQLDPTAGRHLPPGARRLLVTRDDGRTFLALISDSPFLGNGARAAARAFPTRPRRIVAVRFPLGTDRLGRDCLSRLLQGARVSVALGVACAAVATTIGLAIGMLAALSPPVVDRVLMRLLDALLSVPRISLVLLVSALLAPGAAGLVAILALTSWMGPARVIRAEVRTFTAMPAFEAAVASGSPPRVIACRHVLPHVLPTAVVAFSLLAADLMLLESAIAFLGFGVRPETASWGRMIADGAPHVLGAWWVSTLPAVCLAAVVTAFNLSADRLRHRLDNPISAAGRC